MGGIERVVLEHLRIFSSQGADVELLLNRPPVLMKGVIKCKYTILPDVESERHVQLSQYLQNYQPDLLIFHGVSHSFGKQDVRTANENCIKNVCVIHFPFMSNIALDGGEENSWKIFLENGRQCTAFATVSEVDAHFWRALGIKAFHVQNPFVHPSTSLQCLSHTGDSADDEVNIIWVGRICEQKQPKAALAAFALALKQFPHLSLMMIGGDAKSIKKLKKTAEELNIAGKVIFVPERPDINEYWVKADIHLLTSICESFCLVWAEAKAIGVPTVMYELPYLDLAKDKRGYIAVEPKNNKALANAIVDLAKNKEKRIAMGYDAKESLATFNDEAVWDSWMRLYDGLNEETAGGKVDEHLRIIVEQLYKALCHDKETHRWPERMENDFKRLTKCSMKSFANLLHGIVECTAKLKRKLH